MSCRLWVVCGLLLLAGCSNAPRREFDRVAIIRFENLGASRDSDWVGRALEAVLVSQISGSPDWNPFGAATLPEALASGASQVVHGYYSVSGTTLRVNAGLEDRASNRITRRALAQGRTDGILGLADSIARQFGRRARAFGTANLTALRAYADALSPADPDAANKHFAASVAADPNFGEAYVAWAQALLSRGDREGLERVLVSAASRQVAPIERARLEALAAGLRGDRETQRAALLQLTRLTPADGRVFSDIAELDFLAHRFPASAAEYAQASFREPENPLYLNQLGYAQAYAGDLDSAVKSLRRYAELRPGDANPIDSLGDVHYMLGRFAEAEKYYREAYANNPALLGGGELEKAGWARVMTGDIAQADKTFNEYIAARRRMGDPLAGVRTALWYALTGRTAQASREFESSLGSANPIAKQFAAGQLAMMALASGDRTRAQSIAATLAPAGGNVAAALGQVISFVAQPSAPAAEWNARAVRAFPAPEQAGLRQLALAHALLLDGKFADAISLLRQLYVQSPPNAPQQWNVLLAWALQEGGHIAATRDLLATWPLPQPNSESLFATLVFPRVVQLRARMMESTGDTKNARLTMDLFRRLAGDAAR